MDFMDKLIQEYVESFPQKKESFTLIVNSLIRSIEANQIQDWKTLETLTHKFAGSSGTYGFSDLSAHAKYLELEISDDKLSKLAKKKPEACVAFLNKWLVRFETLMQNIDKETFKKAA